MSESAKKAPYHHGDLREALLLAGRRLLEEEGLGGFTLRECARRAEVSHAAPAHHFKSVDDLLAEIAVAGLRRADGGHGGRGEAGGRDPAARLVGQGVGYMAFAAAHPMLFRLMFNRESDRFETPALAAAARSAREMHFAAIEAAIPLAPKAVRIRMSDFAWATVHGFITLLLERQIGEGESARALKARGLAILADMAETVMRAGGVPD